MSRRAVLPSTSATRRTRSSSAHDERSLHAPRALSLTRTNTSSSHQHGVPPRASTVAASNASSFRSTTVVSARTSLSPGRHAAARRAIAPPTAVLPPRPLTAPISSRQLSMPSTHAHGSYTSIHAGGWRAAESQQQQQQQHSSGHKRVPAPVPGAATAAAASSSHVRAATSPMVASVSLRSSHVVSSTAPPLPPVRAAAAPSPRSSPLIAPVNLMSKRAHTATAGDMRSTQHQHQPAAGVPMSLQAAESTAALMRASLAAAGSARPATTAAAVPPPPRSAPIVSVSLTRATSTPAPSSTPALSSSGPLAVSAAAPVRRRAGTHHRRSSSSSMDEEDDPSLPIEARHERAVTWLMRALSRKEEPLYCPLWFTASDPPALLGLASVRHAYLELVAAFSARAQALAYIDDVHDAWSDDKLRARQRSKVNMTRVLARKPPLPMLPAALQRRPSLSQLPAVKQAALAASAANLPQVVRDREAVNAVVAVASPKLATVSLLSSAAPMATLTPAQHAGSAPTPAAAPSSAAASSATAMLASFDALLAATAGSTQAAVSSGRAKSSQPHTLPRARSASPMSRTPAATTSATTLVAPVATAATVAAAAAASPPVIAVSLASLLAASKAVAASASSSAASLLSSGRLLAGLGTATLPASKPAAAPPAAVLPPPSPPPPPSLSQLPADDTAALAAFKELLASHPVLLKHTVRPPSHDAAAAALPPPPPKPSELRLQDARLYYNYHADKPAEQNRKYVRVREMVDVRAGRSLKLAEANKQVGLSAHEQQQMDACCFHLVSLPNSAREAAAAATLAGAPMQLPHFDELHLQVAHPHQRDVWMRGLRLLMRESEELPPPTR